MSRKRTIGYDNIAVTPDVGARLGEDSGTEIGARRWVWIDEHGRIWQPEEIHDLGKVPEPELQESTDPAGWHRRREVMNRILAAWDKMPDQRLGQLILNAVYSVMPSSLFYCADDRLVDAVERFGAGDD